MTGPGFAGAFVGRIEVSRDTALVVRLSLDAWRERVDLRSSGHCFTVADAEKLFSEGAVAFLARDLEGVPVGSVFAIPIGDGRVELMKLAVPKRDRVSTGVGAALVEAVAAWAKERGATDLRLAVSLYQPELCRYYAHRGFRVVPRERYAHASPNSPQPIVMTRSIAAIQPVQDSFALAVRAIQSGRLVILPTETVYGLGALASDPVAVRRVFATKGRPVDHPLIVHIARRDAMNRWARDIPDSAWQLAEVLWPGPLTLVLKKADWVPLEVTGGLTTVALRVPRHPDALALLGLLPIDSGIAAPSANRFGKVSPTTAADAFADLGPYLLTEDHVIDGGPCEVGVESTILDLTTQTPTILRPGGCPVERIEEVLGYTVDRVAVGPSRAPGMLAAHYAPMAGVLVVQADAALSVVVERLGAGQRVGFLGPASVVASFPIEVVRLDTPDPYNGSALAPVLYARLRDADLLGLDVLVVVAPNDHDHGLGWAVNDRLRRAQRGSTPTT